MRWPFSTASMPAPPISARSKRADLTRWGSNLHCHSGACEARTRNQEIRSGPSDHPGMTCSLRPTDHVWLGQRLQPDTRWRRSVFGDEQIRHQRDIAVDIIALEIADAAVVEH